MKNNTWDVNQTKYFDVNWNEYTEYLSKIAMNEPWSLKSYPNRGILNSYISNTYQKLRRENGIVETETYALFNTGLYSEWYEPIYAYQTRGDRVQFFTDYELNSLGIPERPERANYFADPGLLLFDWRYKINIHYKTILDNPRNMALLPDEVASRKNLETLLDGAILQMCRQVSANYKLAIPQYSNGSIQLLLPLCLVSPTKADLALKMNKFDGYYLCNTCLSLEEAYNNARLIARLEDNWLSLSIKDYEAPTTEQNSLPGSYAAKVHVCTLSTRSNEKESTIHRVSIRPPQQGDDPSDYTWEVKTF